MLRQPRFGGPPQSALFLGPDHLERVTQAVPALGLHLAVGTFVRRHRGGALTRRRQKGKHRKRGRLDWGRPPRVIERQLRLAAFVERHDLACFRCGAAEAAWAKTGFSKRGAWAICVPCVQRRREADADGP